MTSFKKISAAVAALTLAFTASAASAQDQVICAPSAGLQDALKQQFGEEPTGTKGSDPTFDFEIYANNTTKTFSLVGTVKDPAANGLPTDKGPISCLLTGGDDYPKGAESQPWYAPLFGGGKNGASPSAVKPGMAQPKF